MAARYRVYECGIVVSEFDRLTPTIIRGYLRDYDRAPIGDGAPGLHDTVAGVFLYPDELRNLIARKRSA